MDWYLSSLYFPVSEVKDLMPLWYRPNITRDEAILLVKTMSPGSFIVRDSQTVSGGYAITIKVDKDLVRQRKRLDESKIERVPCLFNK